LTPKSRDASDPQLGSRGCRSCGARSYLKFWDGENRCQQSNLKFWRFSAKKKRQNFLALIFVISTFSDTLVIEDDVDALRGAALIRAKHHVVPLLTNVRFYKFWRFRHENF